MPIQLTDIDAKQRYDQEMERYREQVDKKMERPATPSNWPSYPTQPEPMVDSHDEQAPSSNPFALGTIPSGPSFGADPHFSGAVRAPLDGTAHNEPEGYESHWTSCDDAPATPFTLKK